MPIGILFVGNAGNGHTIGEVVEDASNSRCQVRRTGLRLFFTNNALVGHTMKISATHCTERRKEKGVAKNSTV